MQIEYRFEFSPEHTTSFRVDLNRLMTSQRQSSAPDWTRLQHHKCQNCPLNDKIHTHCPAAVDVHEILSPLQPVAAHNRIDVTVVAPQRTYAKRVTLEEGVRSLLGLVMATSACPVFGSLRPAAKQHLPFASAEENTLRVVSFYLMQQYFQQQEGKLPDWALTGLIQQFRALQMVNHSFWQRIVGHFANDANARALLSFFTLSGNMSASLDRQLEQVFNLYFEPQNQGLPSSPVGAFGR